VTLNASTIFSVLAEYTFTFGLVVWSFGGFFVLLLRQWMLNMH